jgi:hypothetical protein
MIIVKAMAIYRKGDMEKRPKMTKVSKQFGFSTYKQLERYRAIVQRTESKRLGYEVDVLLEYYER